MYISNHLVVQSALWPFSPSSSFIFFMKRYKHSQSVYLLPTCMAFWLFFYLSFYIEGMIPFPPRMSIWKPEERRWHWSFQLGGDFQWGPIFSDPFPWTILQNTYIFCYYSCWYFPYGNNINRSTYYLQNANVSDIVTISKSYNMYKRCLILSSIYRLRNWRLRELNNKTLSLRNEMPKSGFWYSSSRFQMFLPL